MIAAYPRWNTALRWCPAMSGTSNRPVWRYWILRLLPLREEGGVEVGDVWVGGEPGALQVAGRKVAYGARVG